MQSPLIFDSHSHYNDPRFFGDEMNDLKMSRDELIAYLLKNGVGKILCAGTDIATSRECIELAERFDGVYAAAGIHPHDTELVKNKAECIKELISLLRHKKVVAIGEIGLDFHYDFSDRLIQMEWLDLQLRLAKECNMPVIIHDREAHGATYDIISRYPEVRGVIHSYSGSAESAAMLVKRGYYISFSGTVTFKNASSVVLAAKAVPLDKLLIETDAPYLSPAPNRGKINHSGNLVYTAERIAEIRGISTNEVIEATYNNAKTLFGIE
ncbi:MAG: TatD family hydrolase [Clostridia bacterium]|nr:TatD family hydrolase [Clostridia bacterium]